MDGCRAFCHETLYLDAATHRTSSRYIVNVQAFTTSSATDYLCFILHAISRKIFLELPFAYNVYLNVYVLTKEFMAQYQSMLYLSNSANIHFIIINIVSKFQNDTTVLSNTEW